MSHPDLPRPAVVLRHPLNAFMWLRAIEMITVLLPRRACYLLSDLITTAVYLGGPGLRATLSRTAARVLDGRPVDRACRLLGWHMLRNHGYVIVDYMLMARSSRRALRALMPRRPADAHRPLRRALETGRGAILVSIHFGHWELGGAYLAELGYRLHIVTGSSRDDPVERHRTRTRAQARLGSVHMTLAGGVETDLVSLLPSLRRGEVVAMLADRPGSKLTVEAPYLGRPTVFPAGPALLSWLTGAPLVPAVFHRLPNGTYEGRILEPIPPDSAAPREAELERLTTRMAAAFEPWVRAHPEQWYNLIGHGT